MAAQRVGVVAAVAMLLGAVGIVVLPVWANVTRPAPVAEQLHVPLDLPPPVVPESADPSISALESDLYLAGAGDAGWQVVTVRRNETLGDIFKRLGLSATIMHKVLDGAESARQLTQIYPGDQIAFRIPSAGKLTGLQFDRDEAHRVLLSLDDGKIKETVIERALERRAQYGSAEIRGSLFGAGEAAGLSDALIMRLANVFNYDIDFAQDIRPGDSFSVVYEQIYRDGVKLRDGEIVAAVFINQGKRFEAFRFVDSDGRSDYYNAEGRSLRRAFIRTPVEFTRISSRFSLARRHPILGRMRAHNGVDYAAPTGTPVRAAGHGKVLQVGWQNGYGKTIVLQHGREVTTLYGHLSGFAKGLSRGDKVQQGEVIGYVGMTGLATGPHLHYEFRVNGAHRDPLSVDLPKSEPLSGAELVRFQAEQAPLLTSLNVIAAESLAKR